MLSIQNDQGVTLHLFSEQKLVTELATSWLSDEELPAEFSYPIDCPLNDNNKLFVGHGYRPDRAQPRSVMPVTVRLEGVLYKRCTFAYQLKGGKLNGYLKIDSAEVYDRIRKLSLLEALPDTINLGNGLNAGGGSLAARMKAIAAMAPGSFPLTFFPIRNQLMLEDSFSADKLVGYVKHDYVNHFEAGNFKTDGSTTAEGYLVVPQLYLWYVLERIMNLAGYRIESDWLAQQEVQRLVVVNLTAMSVSGTVAENLARLVTGHSIVAGMHLPDMSVSDFLKAIKGRFGLNISYNANDRVCTITQFVGAIKAGAAIDLTEYQSGSYDTSDPDQRGYTVRDYVDSSDQLYRTPEGETITPAPFVVGKGGQDMGLKCGSTQLIYEPVPGAQSQYWPVPTVRQPGNVLDNLYALSDNYLDKNGNRKNNIGLKLLSYRGLVAHSAGNIYPLASPDVRDGLQQVVSSQSLALGGKYGAWRQYLRMYFHFRDNTQKITQPLLMPVSVLAGLKLHRLVQLSLEDHIRRSYLISKVQAEDPGPSGLCTVRLEVLTIPSGLELGEFDDVPTVYLEFFLVPDYAGLTINYGTISIKAWTSPAKTTPATLINLPVIIRTKRTHYDTISGFIDYGEYLTTYYANGTGSIVLDTRYVGFRADLNPDKSPMTSRNDYAPSLDPGENYIILK